jgi:hypothetical protein
MRVHSIGSLSLTMWLHVGATLLCPFWIPSPATAFIQAPNGLRYHGGKVSSSSLKSTADICVASGAGTSPLFQRSDGVGHKQISKLSATLSKAGMIAFIVSMCLTLPFALIPPQLLYRVKLISKIRQQQMALASGQFCARWLLRLIPFCKVTTIRPSQHDDDPQPSIWVCNHTSALDVFILLAADLELRGKKKRPIKIVYVRMEWMIQFHYCIFLCSVKQTIDTVRRMQTSLTFIIVLFLLLGIDTFAVFDGHLNRILFENLTMWFTLTTLLGDHFHTIYGNIL